MVDNFSRSYKLKKIRRKKVKSLEGAFEYINKQIKLAIHTIDAIQSMKKSIPKGGCFKMKTKEEARQEAINYQHWQSKQALSYRELIYFQEYFNTLAKIFGLVKEFKENGVI